MALTIACFGDSLIEGYPYSSDAAWIAACAKASNGYLKMLNYGVAGECIDEIYDRLRYYPLAKEITHLLFQGGMNDILQGKPRRYTLADLEKVAAFAAQKTWQLCLVLPWLTGDEWLDRQIKELQQDMKSHFAATEIFFLDFAPCLSSLRQNTTALFLDGVHPTQATYRALGEYAAPVIKAWTLKEKDI